MPKDSNGNFTRTIGDGFEGPTAYQDQAADTGPKGARVYADQHDTEGNDFAQAHTDALDRTGKGKMLADLDVDTFKITGSGFQNSEITPENRTTSRSLSKQAALAQGYVDITDPQFGADKTGATFSTQAVIDAVAAGYSPWCPQGRYRFDTRLADQIEVWRGIRFMGEGGPQILTDSGGTIFQWEGSGYLFDFRNPLGTTEVGDFRVDGISFEATQNDGGIFNFCLADNDFDANTDVDTGADQFNITRHTFLDGQRIRYNAKGGTVIGGLSDETDYYCKRIDDNSFQVSATQGGAAIDLTSKPGSSETQNWISVMTDGADSPYYTRLVEFTKCRFKGPSETDATANAIQALGTFELTTDYQCQLDRWRRAVNLIDCDNPNIAGRFVNNGIHINCQRAGGGTASFGNSTVINAPTLLKGARQTAESGNTAWVRIGGGVQATLFAPWCEGDSENGLDLAGTQPRIYNPHFAGQPAAPYNVALTIRQNCTEGLMDRPQYTGGAGPVIKVESVTDEWFDISETGLPRHFRIVDPTRNFYKRHYLNAASDTPNARVPVLRTFGDDLRMGNTAQSEADNVVITSNGIARERWHVSAYNFNVCRAPLGVGIDNLVEDTTSGFGNQAIALKQTPSNSGFNINIRVGDGINEGDQIQVDFWHRGESAPTSGTLRWIILRNNVSVGNNTLGMTGSYQKSGTTYTLSGFSAGDTLGVGCYASGLDVRAFVAAMVIRTTTP